MNSPDAPNPPSAGYELNDLKISKEQICEYLESLELEIQDLSDGDRSLLLTSHEGEFVLMIGIDEYFFTIITSFDIKICFEEHKIKLFEILNNINANTLFSRWYCQGNEDGFTNVLIATSHVGFDRSPFKALVLHIEEETLANLEPFHELERSNASSQDNDDKF